MTALWTSTEAAAATGGKATSDWQASGVSIDSRSIEEGDLFVAIVGPNTDGHHFVENAFAGGAVAAVVTAQWAADRETIRENDPLLLVADTMAGLEALARGARERSSARIAAITGSAGKTGTKDALAVALTRLGRTAATRGNLNNQWGLPLSLARMPADSDYGVFELGMSHRGEIAHLASLARPHVAVITNVEAAHLAFFESEQAIADAKAEIFGSMDATGAVLLNRDNQHFSRLHRHAEQAGLEQIYSFGEAAEADFQLLDYALAPEGSEVCASVLGDVVEFRVGAPGRHWVQNSLAVIGTAHLLGAEIWDVMAALAEAQPAKGRGLHHRVALADDEFELIDESYNANPASMRAAIEVLATLVPRPGGRRIAVLGDMLELGSDAANLHRDLAAGLGRSNVDLIFLAGQHMAALADALPESKIGAYATTSEDLVDAVVASVAPGDVVLVKGSLGSAMAPIVEALLAIKPPTSWTERQVAGNNA